MNELERSQNGILFATGVNFIVICFLGSDHNVLQWTKEGVIKLKKKFISFGGMQLALV